MTFKIVHATDKGMDYFIFISAIIVSVWGLLFTPDPTSSDYTLSGFLFWVIAGIIVIAMFLLGLGLK